MTTNERGDTMTTEYEQTAAVAEVLGAAINYHEDGRLILVAQGETGQDIWPIVRSAVDLALSKARDSA